MKRCVPLPLFLFFVLTAAQAQHHFRIHNRVVVKNVNSEFKQITMILPIPQSNCYQTIRGLTFSKGEVLDLPPSNNRYLREIKQSNFPIINDSCSLDQRFDVVLYPMKIDFSKFDPLYPYNTASSIYKTYTQANLPYIDPHNQTIKQLAQRLWLESKGDAICYARCCYEYVAANYSYKNPNTGIHPLQNLLDIGGGDCGNLSSIFISLLRAKQIPSRHIVTVRPNGTYHVWADFYLERHGWIPVDVTRKLEHPQGDYFGYCAGDGVVMTEGIVFDIDCGQPSPCRVTLLQNYLAWYWTQESGTTAEVYHLLESYPVPH